MQKPDVCLFFRKRYLVCLLASIGMACNYILRTNLSIVVVEMTSAKSQISQNQNLTDVPAPKAEFEWDSKTKGLVLGVFSIGYMFGPFGGMLGLRFGGTTVFGVSMAITAFLTVLSPVLLRSTLYVYILARILEGVFESFSMACLSDIFLRWAPPNERCRMLLIGAAGSLVGAALNYPLSGFIAQNYGWEAVFFVTGGIALIWYVVWFILISDDPTTDRIMTHTEREYFRSFILVKSKKDRIQYPWKQIFASKPFWALKNEFFSYGWLASFSLFCVPLYINDVYHVSIQNIGLISAIPNIAAGAGLIVAAFLSDYLRSKGVYSKQFLHRGFITIGQISGVICLAIIGLWADFKYSIIFLSLNRFLSSFAEMSYFVLPLDMFIEYAGIIRGFCTIATSISFFLNPVIMGFIVADHSRSSWNIYFLFLCGFNIWSLVIFYFYGSGEMQKWAAPTVDNDPNKNKSEET